MKKIKQSLIKKEKEVALLQLIMKKIRHIKERKSGKQEKIALENLEEQLNQM